MDRFANTERLGVNAIEEIFLQFGWIPRTIHASDVGIDMEIEICKRGKPTGKLLAAQIKSGASYFREKKGRDFVVYRPTNVHLDYWLDHTLPVLIILHNPKTNTTIWQSVKDENIVKAGKARKIHIPFSQSLNIGCKLELEELNKYSADYIKLQRLQLHRPLMALINEGSKVVLELTDWVNKSMGRVEIEIINADDSDDEVVITEEAYMRFKVPDDLYTVFPWANFEVDQDYYDYEEEDAYTARYGIWDPEDQTYYFRHATYEEFKEAAPKIRPFMYTDAEIEKYRLEMSLNTIGTSFLALQKYLYGENKEQEDE